MQRCAMLRWGRWSGSVGHRCIRPFIAVLLCSFLFDAMPAHGSDGSLRPSVKRRVASSIPPLLPRRRLGAWEDNQHGMHYLMGPSAVRMDQGEGYYQTAYMLLHQAYYAPVDGFAIGGGFQALSVVRALGGYNEPIAFFALRGSGAVGDGLYVGAFALGAHLGEAAPFDELDKSLENIGLFAGQFTIGRPDLQFTGSFGWGAYGEGLTEEPLYGLGLLVRVSGLVAIVSENWSLPFGPEPIRLYSYAGRLMYRKFATDVGFVNSKEFRDFFVLGVPFVGIALHF